MGRKMGGSLFILLGILLLVVLNLAPAGSGEDITMVGRATRPIYPILLVVIGIGFFRPKAIATTGVTFAGPMKRALSLILDGIILGLPVLLLQFIAINISKSAYFAVSAVYPILIMTLWVYLVWKHGATPGKMIMRIVILTDNFEKVSLRNAVLRSSVDIAYSLLTTVGMLIGLQKISFPEFQNMGFSERSLAMVRVYPYWVLIIMILQQYWEWSEVLVMSLNKRRKAIHDYIAGTVVVDQNP